LQMDIKSFVSDAHRAVAELYRCTIFIPQHLIVLEPKI
jgi:hypothetical protein